MSLIFVSVFLACAATFIIFNNKVASDFAKECSSNTGMAF